MGLGEAAMLKITQIDDGLKRTFKLEGKLLEPWIEEVRNACGSLNGRLPRRASISPGSPSPTRRERNC